MNDINNLSIYFYCETDSMHTHTHICMYVCMHVCMYLH